MTGHAVTPPYRRVALLRRGAVLVILVIAVAACTGGSSGNQEQIARGEELYQANCAACHGGATGGDIADIPPRHNAEGHTWHHPDCVLVEIVQDGMPPRAGTPTMPAFGDELNEQEIAAVLAFVKTWWTEEQLASQETVTEQACE